MDSHSLFKVWTLKWKQIVDFVTLASRLNDPILLAQPAGISVTEPPAILPPSVAAFLGSSCNLTPPAVENCWKILKTTVWNYSESKVETAFAEHGVKHSLSMHNYHTILLGYNHRADYSVHYQHHGHFTHHIEHVRI